MNLHLKDKVVIVTGGSTGIGAAVTQNLLTEGAIPVVVSQSPLQDDLLAALNTTQASWRWIQIDLTDAQACEDAIAQTVAAFGCIDGLVNNAAITHSGGKSMSEISIDTWDQVMNVNVRGVWQVTVAAFHS